MNFKLSRLAAALAILAAPSAWADDPFFFSTGTVTNAVGMGDLDQPHLPFLRAHTSTISTLGCTTRRSISAGQ